MRLAMITTLCFLVGCSIQIEVKPIGSKSQEFEGKATKAINAVGEAVKAIDQRLKKVEGVK